uniref:Glycosyl transferase group 1 n=1 Tax=Providencia alcalifaciens TaxID=126385 RepID=A0A346CLJ2_9GAMM|nr:glycosyl transferase group 1 [Providencia alcalifaciens]
MNIIFQPYYYWTGHFKQYADSLLGSDDILIKSKKNKKYSGFISYCYFRFYYFTISLFKLIKYKKKINNIFILDFEPISILLFNRLIFKKEIQYIITIHAIEKNDYKSTFKNKVAQFQRFALKSALATINKKFNCKFVVHTHAHQTQLIDFLKTEHLNINVIEYPAPQPASSPNSLVKSFNIYPKSLLVFGAIRADKGLYEFIESIRKANLDESIEIIFAGKVMDDRFDSYIPPKNVKIINKFLTEPELHNLVQNCHFFLVPYAKNYTGGAGPAKDATSYGKPIITSNLAIFNEFSKNSFVYTINDANDLNNIINNITDTEYDASCVASLEYSKLNNWSTFRNKYISL